MKPENLGARGGRFWEAVTARFDLGLDELELLRELCRTLDTIEGLEAETPSVGVARELRLQRGELRHLTAALGLPDERGQVVESGNTKRARRAAEARWKEKAHGEAAG